MTAPLLALSLRSPVRVLSLICAQFIAMILARLAHWRRASRPRLRPARSRYAYSGFRRFACVAMAIVMFLQVPASPHVSHAVVETISAKAINSWREGRFWWHSSGWAARMERFRNEFLPRIGATAKRPGWDGRGAPRSSRPAPQEVETQQEREQRVALIKIFPGDVEIKTGEHVVFNAVAFDRDGIAVNGLDVKWSALHEEKKYPITISHGTFVSGAPGKFVVMAEIAGRKEQVKVTVTGETRRPNIRSRSETPKSSRESRRIGSLRAPVSGDQKRIARRGKQARMPALPGLRAASASMAAAPALQFQGEDPTGWNSLNNDTADDVGSERGVVTGRAIDGGVGSANFQFAAPAVVSDGRGIESSLGNPQTLNMYAYCGNDPINHVDPNGLFFKKLFGWIGKIFKVVAIAVLVAGAVLLTAGVAAAAIAGSWAAGSALNEDGQQIPVKEYHADRSTSGLVEYIWNVGKNENEGYKLLSEPVEFLWKRGQEAIRSKPEKNITITYDKQFGFIKRIDFISSIPDYYFQGEIRDFTPLK